ncbi:MAG: hypothetical protein FGM26_13370 [Beijerinckiaceae bacterium]|nr:hypothetical protein [Beijerinckiaceae bacterium]
MAPRGLETPEACMIAIMHGLEVGLSPLSALQRIAVINGRPTIWGDGALALVKASGQCEAIEEWIEGDDPQTWIAVCNLIRRHDPVPVERRFSTEDAKRARLWGKSGPWSDYPKRMLQMRARAFALRDAFPDVLGGLYLTEEFLAEHEPRAEPERSSDLNTGLDMERQYRPEAKVLTETRDGSGKEFAPFETAPRSAPEPKEMADDAHTTELALTTDIAYATNRDDGRPTTASTDPLNANNDLEDRQRKPAAACVDGAYESDGNKEQDQTHLALATQIHPPIPPLANLPRSRTTPRHVRALRFRNQWSIKQPRGPRKELHQNNAASYHQGEASSPVRQSPVSAPEGQSSLGQRLPHADEGSSNTQMPSAQAQALLPRSIAADQGFIPPDDINAHLDLYDAALCCATDHDTLSEIAEEFIERLAPLPLQARLQSEHLFAKHKARLAADPHTPQPLPHEDCDD